MISFRYHVVTIVAVFLALAAGIALGGGPLSELGRSSDEANARVTSENDRLSGELEKTEQVAAFQDAFTNASVPGDLSAVLVDQSVAIVAMPGASSATIKGFNEQITRAEGTVVGTYAVQPGLVATDNKSLADELGSQLLETVESPNVAEDASTYERLGGLISRAIAVPEPAGAPSDQDAKSILSSLQGADMLSVSAGGDKRASLVLVVLGSEPPAEGGSDKLLAALFAGLSSNSGSVVVAGDTASSTSGILKVLRDDPQFTESVSSVDSTQTRTGRIAAVYALGRLGGAETGHFGANGADGPLPRG